LTSGAIAVIIMLLEGHLYLQEKYEYFQIAVVATANQDRKLLVMKLLETPGLQLDQMLVLYLQNNWMRLGDPNEMTELVYQLTSCTKAAAYQDIQHDQYVRKMTQKHYFQHIETENLEYVYSMEATCTEVLDLCNSVTLKELETEDEGAVEDDDE